MQYHLNGFLSGDPSIALAGPDAGTVCDDVDVLIVGCGPAGLTLATQLAAFPEITTMLTDLKPGLLEVGQADGLACRSVEMFESFGFAEKVLKEAYWVNEVGFWRPDDGGAGLIRADRIADVEYDLSEMPHVILNQALLRDLADKRRWPPTREDLEQANTGVKLLLNFDTPSKISDSYCSPCAAKSPASSSMGAHSRSIHVSRNSIC